MVCSKCGQQGHNARTCGKRVPVTTESVTVPNIVVEETNILETPKEVKVHDIKGFFGGAKRILHPPKPSTINDAQPAFITTFENISTITLVSSPSSIAITSTSRPIVSESLIHKTSDGDEEQLTAALVDLDDPKPIEEELTSVTEATPTSAISPSAEQQFIIDQIGAGNNVVADCVAGSGKTTTVLFLAQQFPNKRILQITYNKDLKLEVREKADARGITNLEIHTYHSLCVKYYNRSAHTDYPMRNVVERNTAPICALPHYDIVVLDEVQDMTILYYWMVKKLLRDCSNGPQPLLLVLGDRYQAINQFRAADPRFITLSNQIWERPFVNASLTTSYRLTDQMAAFVNDIMLGSPRIHTVRSGHPVKYVITNTFNNVSQISNIITAKLKDGYTPDDIFILAPSIKSEKSPVRKLENKLVETGVPCFYPTSDDRELDSKVIAGKVVFCTFHQSKGRERPIVLVYSFDSSYFKFCGKDMNPLVCPNTMYVAATRARDELILVSNNSSKVENTPLQFLTINHENELSARPYVCCIGEPRPIKRTDVEHKNESRTSVTGLTKHIKEHPLFLLNNICSRIFTNIGKKVCNISVTSKLPSGKGMCEDVSELNGLIIPGLFEHHTRGTSNIEHVVASSPEVGRHMLVQKLYGETNITTPSLVDYTKITVMYYSIVEELLNKIAQVPRYDWLTEDAVARCHAVMKSCIPKITDDAVYEDVIKFEEEKDKPLLFPKYGKLEISGRMDLVTETDVFELKCVQELTLDHKLQLLIYAWLWNVSGRFAEKGSRRFKLLNVRTGELWELDVSSPLLREAMEILLDNKYGKGEEKPDSIFIEECLKFA
jgi:hypothetical protein